MSTFDEYSGLIARIKNNIRQSRYQAARSVNREMLLLYYGTGKILAEKIKEEEWGMGVLKRISNDIQEEFHGIKGFSVRNLKNMKLFHQTYSFLESLPLMTQQSVFHPFMDDEANISGKGQAVPAQTHATAKHASEDNYISPKEIVRIS